MTALQSVQEPRRIKRNSCAGAKRRPGDDTWGLSETQKPPVGQISKFMSSPGSKKYSAFPVRANHLCKLAPSRPQRGGSRSSRTRGGTRWTRQRRHAQWSQGGLRTRERVTARRRTAVSRTAKSCGPDAPTLASSFCGGERRPTGRTSPPIRKATVARKPGHRGEREGSR